MIQAGFQKGSLGMQVTQPASSLSSTRIHSQSSRSADSSANCSLQNVRSLQDETESKGTWGQKEFMPGVLNLLYMCHDLWDTGQQSTKDTETPEELAKCRVDHFVDPFTRSVDSDTPVHETMLTPEMPVSALSSHGSMILMPNTLSPPLSWEAVNNFSPFSGFRVGTGIDEGCSISLSKQPAVAEPSGDMLNEWWDLPGPTGNAFAQVPLYGCAGNNAVPRVAETPNVRKHVVHSSADDVDSEDEAFPDDFDDAEVLVGPTHLAVKPFRLEDQALPQRCGNGVIAVPLKSSPGCISLSDALRLAAVRAGQAPLSFGSTLHLCMGNVNLCRPCMFERWVGRCTKGWLCDFCHLHVLDNKHSKGARKNSMEDQWYSFGKRPKSL